MLRSQPCLTIYSKRYLRACNAYTSVWGEEEANDRLLKISAGTGRTHRAEGAETNDESQRIRAGND
eukprot:454665-Pleurochrysis_carterae.AAC.3